MKKDAVGKLFQVGGPKMQKKCINNWGCGSFPKRVNY